MDDVELLLARLLADWEVDTYVRLERGLRTGGFAPALTAGLSDAHAEKLARSSFLNQLVTEAINAGTIAEESDLPSDPRYEEIEELGLTAIAVWPLGGNGAVPGCLLFGSRRVSSFSESLLTRLQEFGEIVFSYSTEKERSVRQLRRLVIQLTEAEDRERNRIAALLHDDLQQTLAGIKVHIDMASRQTSDNSYVSGRLKTAVSLLESAIERSRHLSHELNPPALRTRGLVPALEMLAAETERAYHLEVSVDAPEDTLPLSDFARIVTYRAVQELLFNIVKHAGVDDATIQVKSVEDGIEIVVRDRGHGFDTRKVLTRDSPTGLGLLSVRERVEAIGGVLQIESLPGEGSTFTIFLPPEATRAQGVLMRTAEGAEAPTKKTKVVLVDDHAVIRQGIALLLNEEPDLQVVAEADNGSEAIDLVRELAPDVVVMDLTMPGMNGDQATRELLAQSPSTRVIGLSMHAEQEAKDAMLAAGAVAYLPKAGPSSELIAAIRGDESD